jgi:hypothetical protein
MSDVLGRLRRALPEVESWMRDLHARHRARARRVSSLGFSGLAAAWPAAFLQDSWAVSVDELPFPPVAEYGVPEFEAMARGNVAGITFGEMYFVVGQAHGDEGTHFHELCHVVQWKTLGVAEFLLTYALGILRHGYERSPLEAIAFELQAEFARGQARAELVEIVGAHAKRASAAAQAEILRSDRDMGRR